MRKYIQLEIPVPCHEKWEKMTPVEQGRFCNACLKNVVDFRNMSDDELLNYFLDKKNADTCGHYRADQLSRKILETRKPLPWFRYVAASLFPALLLSIKVKGQGVVSKPRIEIVPSNIKAVTCDALPPVSSSIKGQVLDENGNGIPNVSVELVPGNRGTLTDSIGNFAIEVDFPEGKLPQLKFGSIGYQLRTLDLATLQKENYKIVLTRDIQMMGEIIIQSGGNSILGGRMGGMTIKSRVGFIDTLKAFIWPEQLNASVYPNPVRKEETLQVRAKLTMDKEYHLSFADGGGRILLNKQIRGTHSSTVYPVSLPGHIAAGTYFITLRDKKSKTVLSEKVIIL